MLAQPWFTWPQSQVEPSLGATLHVVCSGLKVTPPTLEKRQVCHLTDLILWVPFILLTHFSWL